jgi:hypothetical protein
MWTDRQVTCCTAKAENGAMDDQFRRVLSVLFTVQERAEKQDNDKILCRMWGVYGSVIKMPKLPKTPKGWYSSDVMWHVPDNKKPIAYSTAAASRLIVVLSRDGCTIKELLSRINYDTEAKKVIKQYIDKGYGDIIAKKFFS